MRGAALIVLAWNQWPTTRRCLDSLLATRPHAAEVIVVDNGSCDETPTELAAYADRVRVVALPQNLGFVRGMNAGIAAARADDDVVLLNNDLVFSQPDWLERLRDAAYAAPDIGVVGCRQLGPEAEGRLYHAGGFIEADELHGQQVESGPDERDVAQYDTTRRVQGIAFALAYLRRDCLDRIGVLDPVFHSYFEDTDYCLRAADAGIATVVAGAVTLHHHQHGSTRDDGGFRRRLWEASRASFAARWQGRLRDAYRGDVVWHGAARRPYADAHLAHAFVRRLDARGLRMLRSPAAAEVAPGDDFRLDIAARRRARPPYDAAIACGAAVAPASARVRIGLRSGEWERVPVAWAVAARSLDLLLVPDAFQRDAFRAAGVDVPIEILPPGVDRDYCHPRVPAPRDPHGRLVFLAVVDAFARDAPDRLVRAFRAAFDRDERVALLVHVRPGVETFAIADALAPLCAGDERIRLLVDWAHPWYQRAQLLAGADVYVGVRRGGGWDPYAAEALACGKLLVAADFGSQQQLARAHGSVVACRRAIDPASGLAWAEPDHDAFVAALRDTHARHEERLAQARRDADAFALAHDVEASADRLAARVGEFAGLRAAAPSPRPHRPLDLARAPSGQIIVLGMHRSGASSVAGLLARMGVAVGPEHDLLQGPDNPRGHYESGRLHMACVRRLAAAGGAWREPPIAAVPAAIDAFRREVGTLVDEFDAQRPWLFKEPRLCLLAREMLPLLTRPLFVHVVRDPVAVADSLAARDGFAPADALALWERHTRDAFEASRGWPRIIVDYDALCADPEAETRRLFDALRGAGVERIRLPPADVVRAWIEPNRQRVRASAAKPTAAQHALQASIADRSILADAAPAAPVAVPRSA
ncbi:MAG: glycosyltransferase [Dokdonella sp.]|uniref:glycosyltransferase n=1 Tax=Dokdonella sp. TaxID=2291710 RepID=UPI003F81E92E